MKVRIAGPAQRQADIIDRWWRKNRPEAKRLFAQEFAEARRLIARVPEVGAPYLERGGVLIRRVVLHRTRNHVYYEVDRPARLVTIVAVWGALRGEGPPL